GCAARDLLECPLKAAAPSRCWSSLLAEALAPLRTPPQRGASSRGASDGRSRYRIPLEPRAACGVTTSLSTSRKTCAAHPRCCLARHLCCLAFSIPSHGVIVNISPLERTHSLRSGKRPFSPTIPSLVAPV